MKKDGWIRRKRYTPDETRFILDALEPRTERLRRVAQRLGRSPAAIERHYQRVLREYGDTRPRMPTDEGDGT